MAQKSQIKIRENQNKQDVTKGLLRSIVEAIVTDKTASEYMRTGTIGRDQKYGRGEVARNEEIRILERIAAINGEPVEPRTRGEVAAQEQMRIFAQVLS